MTLRCSGGGRPDDYVSLSVGFDWSENADSETAAAYVRSLMDSDAKAEYLGKFLAARLYGRNREERVHFWVGNGRNGKGKLAELWKRAMGGYWGELPLAFYTTSPKQAGGPDADLVATKGKRVVMTSETEADQKFLTSRFKQISGNDTITARGMYAKRSEQFVPAYGPVIQTNQLPQFSDVDDELMSRLAVVEFRYRFAKPDELESGNAWMRPADLDIDKRLAAMREGFMAYLSRSMPVTKQTVLSCRWTSKRPPRSTRERSMRW